MAKLDTTRTGIGGVTDLLWGSHICEFYEHQQDMLDSCATYFEAGLEDNEMCLWVLPKIWVEQGWRALQRITHATRDQKAMEIVAVEDLYLCQGALAPEQALEAVKRKFDFALHAGYQGLRVSGDTSWLKKEQWECACEYEQRLNTLVADRRMLAMCTYPLSNTNRDQVLDVIQLHPVAITKKDRNRNNLTPPAYVTSGQETQQALQVAKQELTQIKTTLEERTVRLGEIREELDHISYSMVHDMRAPLRAIEGFATMLRVQEKERLHPASLDYLQRMEAAAERMDLLITDVLSYSRAVQRDLRLGPVDVEELLRDLVKSYPALAQSRADITLEGIFPVVVANKAALAQCFAHLLGNSVKFVAVGVRPNVRVWAENKPEAGLVRIWVEDNGIGISTTGQDKIFALFQQVQGHHYAGTGVGLAMVRKLAERMRATVGVDSQEGNGSRFWIELKVCQT